MTDSAKQPDAKEGRLAWLNDIPDDQWSVYQTVIAEARARSLPFALGGAFALATYTGHWRNTKDLDLFILPESRDDFVDTLTHSGLSDYYDQLEYDRSWIYRAHREEIIVDVIWSMANHHASVDDAWLTCGPELNVRGEHIRVLPVEEVIWNKLYILHHDRCDWPDVLNLVSAAGPTLDWNYLLGRVAEDIALLRGLLSVFIWLSPIHAAALPAWLWQRLQLPAPAAEGMSETDHHRADLLDTRPWFTSMLADQA
ncbi:MAG: nucleotidyltransferase [Herpetosiphonaceae bacterium]|nr:nucleotidyltransferase [Herpetosiphonaceae bacterium]